MARVERLVLRSDLPLPRLSVRSCLPLLSVLSAEQLL